MAKRFGKYILLDHLAKGGMAELFRAKVTGVAEFERLIAIKCMRPGLANDTAFSDMFVDEANLAGQLSHANIAQIYELGRHKDQLYIAMELVEGRDLRQVLNRCGERDITLPDAFVAYVVTKAAYGLHYAHGKTTADGKPLNLVHRDISPPNILVSFDGEVKVVDFGIAKASQRNVNETSAGVLKGKFAYMAPEQVSGGEVDHRADIFALGVVLYELLTRRRLFRGDTDFEVLQKVESADIPDLRVALPDAPPEVLGVLYNALARDPKDRYANAADMAKDLEPLLIVERTIFGPAEAASFLGTLYDDAERRAPVYDDSDLDELDESTPSSHRSNTYLSAFDGGDEAMWKVSTSEIPAPATTEISPDSLQPVPESALQASAGESGAAQRTWSDRTQVSSRRSGDTPVHFADGSGGFPSTLSRLSGLSSSRWFSAVIFLAVAMGIGLGLYYGLPAFEKKKAQRDKRLANSSSPAGVEKGFGYVTIKVRGAKSAQVLVDGHPVGNAPIKRLRLKTGSHVVKVVDSKRRRRQRSRKINLSEGNRKRSPLVVTVTL